MQKKFWKPGKHWKAMKSSNETLYFDFKEKSWIARLAAWKLSAGSVAIVIGHTIHLHRATKDELLQDERWLKHELCHVRQFEHYGLVNFVVRYVWESIRHGYFNNKFEIEARAAEEA